MNARALLLMTACLCGLFCSRVVQAQEQTATTKQPNIVFCFADDWGLYASCYAKLGIGHGQINDVVKTPNIDQLANSGVLFTNAYVNAPSCTPCRSALLSGRHFWETGRGAILQGAIWEETIPTYPLELKAAGYHLGCSHKVWSPGSPANAPYGAKKHAYNKAGGEINYYSQFVTKQLSQGSSRDDAHDVVMSHVRENFQMCLADAQKAKAPFCYWFGPTNCHRKWVKGSGKALWNIDPNQLEGKLPRFWPDVSAIREDIADYLGEVQAFDAAVGVLIEELKQAGKWDSTILIVSGDHGIPGFPRGKCTLYDTGIHVPLLITGPGIPGSRVVEDFVSLSEIAPTLLQATSAKIPAEMSARPFWDVLTSAQSGLVDRTRNFVVAGRERHVAEIRHDRLPYPERCVRTATHLYIRRYHPDRWPMGFAPAGYGLLQPQMPGFEELENKTIVAFGDMDAGPTKAWMIEHRQDAEIRHWFQLGFGLCPEEELYDLKADPDCLKNLAGSADHQYLRSTMAQTLLEVQMRTGDPRVTETPPRYELPPFTNGMGNRKPAKAR